jgi:hypothetical protein
LLPPAGKMDRPFRHSAENSGLNVRCGVQSRGFLGGGSAALQSISAAVSEVSDSNPSGQILLGLL